MRTARQPGLELRDCGVPFRNRRIPTKGMHHAHAHKYREHAHAWGRCALHAYGFERRLAPLGDHLIGDSDRSCKGSDLVDTSGARPRCPRQLGLELLHLCSVRTREHSDETGRGMGAQCQVLGGRRLGLELLHRCCVRSAKC